MRKFIKITLYMKELMADVKAKTYFTGKNQTDDVEHREYIQELDDSENEDLILRSFSNAIGKASAVISEYAPIELEETSDANISSANDIILVVSMPQNFNEGMTNTLAQVLHAYLVNTAIGDWMLQVMPAGDSHPATYIELSNSNLIQLRNALTRRMRPARSEIVPDIVPYSGAGSYSEKTAATISFSVSKASINIDGTTTNTATTNSDGAVTYSSSDTNVATVDESTGLVTGVASGTATITATVAETEEYKTASATYTLTVRTVPTLTFATSSLRVAVGGSATNKATTDSDGAVSYISANTKIAVVGLKTAIVGGVATGQTTITATVAETDNYTSATATYTIIVYSAS